MRFAAPILIATILALVLATTEEADAQEFLKLAGSLNEPSLLTHKLIAAGVQNKLVGVFDYQLEAGAFSSGVNITGFGGPSLGLSVENPGYYMKIFAGPVIISPVDDHLGTNIEISTDLELGLRDKRGVGIGFGYKHFSNAGTGGPNLGRDFLFFKVSIP